MGFTAWQKDTDMKYTIFAGILIFLATIKIIATLMGWDKVVGIASMTNLTPAMKVFTAHKGYETYSSTFVIEASYADGLSEKKTLTSKVYSHLKGPYNRRNVYGALIAYGPLLAQNPKTKAMYDAMTKSAFCKEPNILTELTFENKNKIKQVTIFYENANPNTTYPTKIKAQCD